jgi:GAF domain-containing protein
LTDRELIEIKNVARQSMTRQLRDYLHYCQATNRCMILYIRPDTHLSRTLREAIAGGSVEIRSLNKLFAQATQQRLREALKPTIMAAMMKALKKPTSAA